MKALGKTVALMCTCFVLNNAQALDSRYHTFPEIQEFLDSLDQISDFNSIYRVDTIGYSSQEQLPVFSVLPAFRLPAEPLAQEASYLAASERISSFCISLSCIADYYFL